MGADRTEGHTPAESAMPKKKCALASGAHFMFTATGSARPRSGQQTAQSLDELLLLLDEPSEEAAISAISAAAPTTAATVPALADEPAGAASA